MRPKRIILLFVIACVGGVIFFFVCKYTYDFKVVKLKEKARNAFIGAVDQELRNRSVDGDCSFNLDAKAAMSAEIPDSVYFEDETGKRWYRLDPKKNRMNITNNSTLRALHSFAFGKKELLADSLNAVWNEQLRKSNIFLESALCVSLINIDGSIKSQNTCWNEWCNSSNLVFTSYIGYACEIEIIGYLCYSVWSIMYKEIFLYLLLYIVLVYGFYKSFIVLRRKLYSLPNKEIIEIEVIKEVPVEVPVIKVVQNIDATIHSYKLNERSIFYSERNILVVDGVEKKIQPQTCRILELFLEEKDHKYMLEYSVIMDKLWPDGSGNTLRMHKAVDRLRALFKENDLSINIQRKNSA
ncbi:helix-turn-helix domain-containing protein, partial [Bacteroides faecis]